LQFTELFLFCRLTSKGKIFSSRFKNFRRTLILSFSRVRIRKSLVQKLLKLQLSGLKNNLESTPITLKLIRMYSYLAKKSRFNLFKRFNTRIFKSLGLIIKKTISLPSSRIKKNKLGQDLFRDAIFNFNREKVSRIRKRTLTKYNMELPNIRRGIMNPRKKYILMGETRSLEYNLFTKSRFYVSHKQSSNKTEEALMNLKKYYESRYDLISFSNNSIKISYENSLLYHELGLYSNTKSNNYENNSLIQNSSYYQKKYRNLTNSKNFISTLTKGIKIKKKNFIKIRKLKRRKDKLRELVISKIKKRLFKKSTRSSFKLYLKY
jgi:hypothetical protein